MAILSIRNVSKSYPRKKVLDSVSLSFEGGRMYALLGENGAGKSTLASVLTGNLRPDCGEFLLDGVTIDANPAETCHIAAVSQIPELVNNISVLDNCILGAEPTGRFGIVRRNTARKELESLCEKWSTGPVLDKKTYSLTAQERFYAAFLSTLYRKPSFLILDEPSATLSGTERKSLFEKLRIAVADGLCVIFITHDIEEAVLYSDAVYVLRDGVVSAQFETSSLKKEGAEKSIKKIYSAMFSETNADEVCEPDVVSGTPAKDDVARTPNDDTAAPYLASDTASTVGDEVLCFQNVSAYPFRKAALHDVSFAVKKGMVTCITGQKESGLDTLEDIVTGMNDFPCDGTIIFMGAAHNRLSPTLLRKNGVGIVPSDKTNRASSPLLSVRDILTTCYNKEKDIIKLSGVDILPDEPVTTLSGGMLQSLVIERELFSADGQPKPSLLIFANPVYGLDRKRTSAIIKRIKTEAGKGAAVLVLAAEGSEVVKHADVTYHLVSGVLKKSDSSATASKTASHVKAATAADQAKIATVAPTTQSEKSAPKHKTQRKKVFIAYPQYALLAGFIAAGGLILLMAKNPWQTLLSFFTAPVSSAFFTGNWLNTATLLLAAAAGAFASITAGSINLGGEGQVYAGGFVAAILLGYIPELPLGAAVLVLLLTAVLSAAAGAMMTAIPAVLKIHKNIEVLLSSFLLSGAVIPCIDSAITNVFRAKNGNLLATPFLAECFRLPQILKPSSLNISVFMVLAVVAFLIFILVKTKNGRIFRISGMSPAFAKLSGFNVNGNFMSGMLISGAFHGLCGFLAVTGTHFTCHSGFYSGFGWNALTAALIAGNNPVMLIPSVLVLSFIYTGCEKTVLTGSMNPDMTYIIQAVILLFVTVSHTKTHFGKGGKA